MQLGRLLVLQLLVLTPVLRGTPTIFTFYVSLFSPPRGILSLYRLLLAREARRQAPKKLTDRSGARVFGALLRSRGTEGGDPGRH